MNVFLGFMADNMPFLVAGLCVIVLLLAILLIVQMSKLNAMRGRYRKMMTGNEGANIERVLMAHIDEVKKVVEENARLDMENRRMDALLQQAVTRVGVVRFRAFEDMGSDLSYAVALLDSYNNGVVLSSIFGREDSRSYVKPIEGGQSRNYKLTAEEEQALTEAMQKAQ